MTDLASCLSFTISGTYSGDAFFVEFCESLLANWGVRFAGPIAILRNWTFCLFYVMAELWGSVVVSLLFWGFANQVSCLHCKHMLPSCLCTLLIAMLRFLIIAMASACADC